MRGASLTECANSSNRPARKNSLQPNPNQMSLMILGVFVSPMKIPLPLRGIRVIREIRGQKKQPRITQISRKTHHKSHLHPQWRAAGSWILGGEFAFAALTTKTP